MPTNVHERFISLVEDAISDGIQQLAERLQAEHEEVAAESLTQIYKGRSPTLELHAPKLENSSQSSFSSNEGTSVVRKSPDATFFHSSENALPALVVEVRYSQQRKDLPRLAESYIVDSRHQIRCVIGLDIAYRGKSKDRAASISIWRPALEKEDNGDEIGICQCDIDALLFQDAKGNACDGQIILTVGDILPEAISAELPMAVRERGITISFAQLRDFLQDVETKQETTRSTGADRKFRKRKRSRSEQLSDDREASLVKLEEAEQEKDSKADGEWQGRTKGGRPPNSADAILLAEAEMANSPKQKKQVWWK